MNFVIKRYSTYYKLLIQTRIYQKRDFSYNLYDVINCDNYLQAKSVLDQIKNRNVFIIGTFSYQRMQCRLMHFSLQDQLLLKSAFKIK